MKAVEFKALEYQADASFRHTSYRYEQTGSGWQVLREGKPHLDLPREYRLLRCSRCGICSTDLARQHLPFRLPQIIGHEVIARDESGIPVAAEINASHFSIGSDEARSCPLCRRGLPTHCPDRMVLGIDRLPGGFAPWILVPERNVVGIPKTLPPDVSVLIEPFAAALHAVERVNLEGVKRVGVLGVGRLGLLILAALRAVREALGESFSIEAVVRNPERRELAMAMGADTVWDDVGSIRSGSGSSNVFDVVTESTGSRLGLEIALSLASREVHVKSTTGLETLGLKHLTELVVDEISLGRFDPQQIGKKEPFATDACGTVLLFGSRVTSAVSGILKDTGHNVVSVDRIEDFKTACRDRPLDEYQADLSVVGSVDLVDNVIRPWPDREWGFLRPRGTVLVADTGQARHGLLGPILDRGVRLSTSRCGDFRKAIPSLEALLHLGVDLGALVTDRFPSSELPKAFERARSPDSIKVVVLHEPDE